VDIINASNVCNETLKQQRCSGCMTHETMMPSVGSIAMNSSMLSVPEPSLSNSANTISGVRFDR
jgi:hypothetical protein